MKKLSILFIIGLFAFCGKERANKNTIKIYIPKTLSSIPVLELKNKTLENKTIHTQFYQDHIMTMAEFVDGKIDILMTGFTLGVSHYNSNKNITMVVTPVWGVSSLVAKKDYKSLEDFVGKKILVPFEGSPLDLQLKTILTQSNMSDKIKIDYAVIQQAVPMLLAGKTDGICIPEPLVSKLTVPKKASRVFYFPDKWAEFHQGERRTPQVALFVKKDFSQKNKQFLQKLIRSISTNINELQTSTTHLSKKHSKTFQLDENIISGGLRNTLFEVIDYKKGKEISKAYLKSIGVKQIPGDDFFLKYE